MTKITHKFSKKKIATIIVTMLTLITLISAISLPACAAGGHSGSYNMKTGFVNGKDNGQLFSLPKGTYIISAYDGEIYGGIYGSNLDNYDTLNNVTYSLYRDVFLLADKKIGTVTADWWGNLDGAKYLGSGEASDKYYMVIQKSPHDGTYVRGNYSITLF